MAISPDPPFIGNYRATATVNWAEINSEDCEDMTTGAVLAADLVAEYVEVETDAAQEVWVLATDAVTAATATFYRRITTAVPPRGFNVRGANAADVISFRCDAATSVCNFAIHWRAP